MFCFSLDSSYFYCTEGFVEIQLNLKFLVLKVKKVGQSLSR